MFLKNSIRCSAPRILPLDLTLGSLSLLLTFLNLTSATPTCPAACRCQGEDNLELDCSGNVLTSPPTTLNSTLTLDLSRNALGPVLNSRMTRMPNLTSVDLSHNGLRRLLVCTFQGFSQLRDVYLGHNLLTALPRSLFEDSDHVQLLDLSHNHLTSLPNHVFLNTPELKFLDVSHNRVLELVLGERFQVPRRLEVMDFSHNAFETVAANSLEMANQWQPNIQRTLKLTNCRLSSIVPQAFRDIPNLSNLDLSGNSDLPVENLTALVSELQTRGLRHLSLARLNLSSLQPLFRDVTHLALKTLNVSGNNLNDIPANTFANVRSLRVLDLSHNHLTSLGQGFSDLVNLRVLNISTNQLATFQGEPVRQMSKLRVLVASTNLLVGGQSASFTPLLRLKHLDVSNNLLTSVQLPSNLTKVYKLDFHSNALTSLPDLGSVPLLEFFDASDNDLAQVGPYLFPDALFLKTANLSRNSVTQLDSRAFLPQSALTIDLSHNELQELHFSNWVATQRLYLQQNDLHRLDVQTFYGMTGLKVLDLSSNKLMSLNNQLLKYLTSLKFLNLSGNFFPDSDWFSLFQHLDSLHTLDLSHNNLSSLNESMLLPTPKLQSLSLSHNHLEMVQPRVFRDLKHLKQLDLSHNPFSCTCESLVLRDWLVRTKTFITGLYAANSTAYHCRSPSHRVGVSVIDWEPEQFECSTTILYVLIFGSVGLFLIVAGVSASVAFRLRGVWKRRKERIEREREEDRLRRSKKVYVTKLTKEEIAEEISEALERRDRNMKKSAKKYRSNGYVPWPGSAKKVGNDGQKMEKETKRGTRESETKGKQPEMGRNERRERTQKEEQTCNKLGQQIERKDRQGERDRQRERDRQGERERGRGREQEGRHTYEAPEQWRVRKEANVDRRRREGRRESDYMDISDYRPRRPAARDGRSASPYSPRREPFTIAYPRPAPGNRWDNVDVWGGDRRGWTLQGHGHSRSQGYLYGGQGYLTLPIHPRHQQQWSDRDRYWTTAIRGRTTHNRHVPEVRFGVENLHRYAQVEGDPEGQGYNERKRSLSEHILTSEPSQAERPQPATSNVQSQEKRDMALQSEQRVQVHQAASDWL